VNQITFIYHSFLSGGPGGRRPLLSCALMQCCSAQFDALNDELRS